MVLLSASTVSTILSGGIICLFTFLLFLSGYILQQNAVDSLRTALEAPLEERVSFDNRYIRNDPVAAAAAVVDADDNTTLDTTLLESLNNVQVVLGDNVLNGDELRDAEATPQQLWHAHIDQSPVASIPPLNPTPIKITGGRFAYVLSLSKPSDLCSAILFAENQRSQSSLSRSDVNIVFLYPANWETSRSTFHTEALAALLTAEHQHSVILHPVPISKVWTGIDVESQLLSELARNPWPYDRVMYLRLPGMVIDANRLDTTMTRTYADKRLLRSGWERLKAGRRTGVNPDVMLFAQGKGLMTPIGDQSIVTARALPVELRNAQSVLPSKDAAFVLFDEGDLSRVEEGTREDENIFSRFQRDRAAVCKDTSLLAS